MIVSDLLRGLLVLLCLTVQSPEQVWVFYVVGFLMSSVSRFFFPSQNAVLPLIVPDKHDLLTANGLMQIVQTVGMLVGPAIAGFAIALWGERVAFLVDSTTFFISALAILIMTVPRTTHGRQEAEGRGGKLDAVWDELREGVVYLFGSRVMVGVLLCMSVVQLGLGAINVLWVPFMQRTFGLGPEGLGAVDVAQGVGMAVGGLLLGFVATRMRKKDLAGWSIILAGLAIVLIGLSPALSLATWLTVQDGSVAMEAMSVAQRLLYMPLLLLLFSMLVGVAIVPAQSSLMTMMQLAVPDLKRGRVGSALNALATLAGLISMALAAALGEVIALRVIYVIAGLVVVGAGLVGLVVLQEPDPQPGDLEQVEVPGLAMGGASD
jgi:MFS family permease